MKSIRLSIVATLLVTTGIVSNVFANEVELSANVAMTSNYVWRGMTQTANSPAIQGGFDVAYLGLYAGVWGSAIDFGNGSATGSTASSEVDVYLGYANEIVGLTYDINYCQYMYPNDVDNLNFGEASLTLGYDFKVVALSAKYYVGVDTNDADDIADDWEPTDGWEAGVSIPLPAEISIDASYGEYDEFGEYYLISASKSFGKFDFTVAYTGITAESGSDDNQDNIVATAGVSF